MKLTQEEADAWAAKIEYDRTVTVTSAQDKELSTLVEAANEAADGDSNDEEIGALQDALDVALAMLHREDLR